VGVDVRIGARQRVASGLLGSASGLARLVVLVRGSRAGG